MEDPSPSDPTAVLVPSELRRRVESTCAEARVQRDRSVAADAVLRDARHAAARAHAELDVALATLDQRRLMEQQGPGTTQLPDGPVRGQGSPAAATGRHHLAAADRRAQSLIPRGRRPGPDAPGAVRIARPGRARCEHGVERPARAHRDRRGGLVPGAPRPRRAGPLGGRAGRDRGHPGGSGGGRRPAGRARPAEPATDPRRRARRSMGPRRSMPVPSPSSGCWRAMPRSLARSLARWPT